MISSAVLVAAVALQTKFLLSNKFSRNPGSIPKAYTHVQSTSEKYVVGFLMKSFGGCGRTVLAGASCWPSSNCVPAQKIVSVSMTELNHDDSPLVLDSDNVVCCHHSSS